MSNKRDDLFGEMASDLDAAGDVTAHLLGSPVTQHGTAEIRTRKRQPRSEGKLTPIRSRKSKNVPERIPEGEPRSQPYGEHGATPGGLIKRTILVEPTVWDRVEEFKRDHRVRSVSEVVRYALEEYLERNT